MMLRSTFVACGASALLSGCVRIGGRSVRFEDVAAGGQPLRSAFNRYADKVRLVLLVSPT